MTKSVWCLVSGMMEIRIAVGTVFVVPASYVAPPYVIACILSYYY